MLSSLSRARDTLRKNTVLTIALSAPSRSSSAAARKLAALVLEYWKQPVSVVRPI